MIRPFTLALLLAAVAAAHAQSTPAHKYDAWKQHVPAADHARVNPLPPGASTVVAGAKLYSEHCARCHGANAAGVGKKPSLLGPDTQQASDGDLFWLLRNGDIWHGMPTWSTMPESERWQIIAYVRSLNSTPASSAAQPSAATH
jgi:mono/diheme cytochrome c family protein